MYSWIKIRQYYLLALLMALLLTSCQKSSAASWDVQVEAAARIARQANPQAQLSDIEAGPDSNNLNVSYKTSFSFHADGNQFSVVVPDHNPEDAYLVMPPCQDCQGFIPSTSAEKADQRLLVAKSVKINPSTLETLTRSLAMAHTSHDYPRTFVVNSSLIFPGDSMHSINISEAIWHIKYQFVSAQFGSDNFDSSRVWFEVYVNAQNGKILEQKLTGF